MRKFFAIPEIAKSLLALLLVALCLLAGNWQWNKGKVLSHQNSIIKQNLTLKPLTETKLLRIDPVANQWRTVILKGKFEATHQLLIRDRYNQGVYGFEVLQLLKTVNANYWIDRGWVKAGATASTPPTIPRLPTETLIISARIRAEDLSHQLHGSFFASTASKRVIPLQDIQGVNAAPYYLDELSSDNKDAAPITVIDLPDLGNGPHFAYALQWLAFAVLILVGRGMLFRETQRLSLEEIKVKSA